MMSIVLPEIEELARELQAERFSILKAREEGKLELTKQQIAQILANGFFCNFKDVENLSHINFDK
jgi:Poly (ADP-ribose) glycohydrolase (PARG)